jgi:hypothetical protein
MHPDSVPPGRVEKAMSTLVWEGTTQSSKSLKLMNKKTIGLPRLVLNLRQMITIKPMTMKNIKDLPRGCVSLDDDLNDITKI